MTAFKTVLLIIVALVIFTTLLSIIGFVFSAFHLLIDLLLLAAIIYVTYLFLRRRTKSH
jgi:c-di-AMP phosphodiesterase-like protein